MRQLSNVATFAGTLVLGTLVTSFFVGTLGLGSIIKLALVAVFVVFLIGLIKNGKGCCNIKIRCEKDSTGDGFGFDSEE